ncbi:glycosyltransferase [Hoeflea sp. AS60]|uniref:glycosyltransferase n=1 Tax=Hoeflea sp. AS60 TaxID=3135780 RepID=UPI003179D517
MAGLGVCLDVIQDHTFIGPHMSAVLTRTPVVTTFHDVGDRQRQIIYGGLREAVGTISVSDHQKSTLIGVRTDKRIYPGLPASLYEMSENKGYLLFVGRFSPEKGAETAIEAARRAKLPIILAGRIVRGQEGYFENCVKPLISDDVKYIGEISPKEKAKLISNSFALINTVKYDEPFGLINAEALLSGVPVISYRIGAFPEIIDHGRNGFLCDNIDDVISAVEALDTLDTGGIRRDAVQRFSLERMVSEHVEFYEEMKSRA